MFFVSVTRAYGPVQDVRIPHQQKRMFGFVTFIYPDTVRTILTEGNPHYICGARVLVKPYKEKGKKCKNLLPSFLKLSVLIFVIPLFISMIFVSNSTPPFLLLLRTKLRFFIYLVHFSDLFWISIIRACP